MTIFDGKKFAELKEEKIKQEVSDLRKKGIIPKMVSVLGDDSPESELYVSVKGKFAKRVDIEFEIHHFEVTDKAEKIIDDVKKVNGDTSVQGLMVQLPISEPFEILKAITPSKDIDCLTPENLGLVLKNKPIFLPASVRATLDILKEALGLSNKEDYYGNWLAGKNICIVGASEIIGKPLTMILSDLGATVMLCRSTTRNLHELTEESDILISATGAPELISEEMVKNEAIVIDVGISRLLRGGKYKVVGDVHSKVADKASFLTPVPGGVGPVTVACLFENLLDAVKIYSA